MSVSTGARHKAAQYTNGSVGIFLVHDAGENITAIGPDSPLIGVYSLDIFVERVSTIIHGHAARMATAGTASNSTEDSKPKSQQPINGLTSSTSPLFLYVAWQNCHDPYDVPQK